MLTLRTLGGLSLHRSRRDGDGPTEVPAPRRTLALLALLAASHGAGVTRDRAAALLWPDSSDDAARNSLRQALFRLKQTVGSAVVNGTSDLRLNESVITSDVGAFCDAIADKRLRDAVESYGGAFLVGFVLRGCDELERWSDERRAELAADYRRALQRLADAATATGALAEELEWRRRLCASDPVDATAAGQYMSALGRAGRAADALRHFASFERVLRAELELEPPADLQEIARALRASAKGAVPTGVEPGVWTAPPEAGVAPVVQSMPNVTAPVAPILAPPPRRRRRWLVVTLALGTIPLALVAVRTASQLRGRAAPNTARTVLPGPRADLIAVLPFSVHSRGDSLDLGEGVSEMLATSLDVPGALRTADQSVVRTALQRTTDTTFQARRRTVAKAIGASHVVTGDVMDADGTLRLSATVWRSDLAGDSAIGIASVVGRPSELFRLVDELTAEILPLTGAEPADRLDRIAARTTESLDALKFYLAGTKALRRGEHARAAAWLERATEQDTTFALAFLRLAMASEWNVQYDRARDAASRALSHAGRLGSRERLLAEALAAYLHGDATRAEEILERAVALHPEDTESWFRLAEVRFHFFASRDLPIEDSRQAWQNVIGLDSNHVGALIHLARIAAIEQDSVAMDRVVGRIRAVSPATDRLWEARAMQAFIGGRHEAERSLTTELLAAGDSAVLAGVGASGYTDNTVALRPLAIALSRSPNREMRQVALLKLAELDIIEGRPRAADRWLDQLATLDQDLALLHRAYFATLPSVRRSAQVLDSLATALQLALRDSARRSVRAGARGAYWTVRAVIPELRAYLAGRIAAKRNRWPDVAEAERLLRQSEGPPPARALAADLALSLEAQRALARADTALAATLLGRATVQTPVELLNSSWFYSQSVEQYERGRLADWSGRLDIALATYATARHSRLLAPIAALRMAEIHERSGDRSGAIREYRRILQLQPRPEPEQEPLAARAAQRLAALGAVAAPTP